MRKRVFLIVFFLIVFFSFITEALGEIYCYNNQMELNASKECIPKSPYTKTSSNCYFVSSISNNVFNLPNINLNYNTVTFSQLKLGNTYIKDIKIKYDIIEPEQNKGCPSQIGPPCDDGWEEVAYGSLYNTNNNECEGLRLCVKKEQYTSNNKKGFVQNVVVVQSSDNKDINCPSWFKTDNNYQEPETQHIGNKKFKLCIQNSTFDPNKPEHECCGIAADVQSCGTQENTFCNLYCDQNNKWQTISCQGNDPTCNQLCELKGGDYSTVGCCGAHPDYCEDIKTENGIGLLCTENISSSQYSEDTGKEYLPNAWLYANDSLHIGCMYDFTLESSNTCRFYTGMVVSDGKKWKKCDEYVYANPTQLGNEVYCWAGCMNDSVNSGNNDSITQQYFSCNNSCGSISAYGCLRMCELSYISLMKNESSDFETIEEGYEYCKGACRIFSDSSGWNYSRVVIANVSDNEIDVTCANKCSCSTDPSSGETICHENYDCSENGPIVPEQMSKEDCVEKCVQEYCMLPANIHSFGCFNTKIGNPPTSGLYLIECLPQNKETSMCTLSEGYSGKNNYYKDYKVENTRTSGNKIVVHNMNFSGEEVDTYYCTNKGWTNNLDISDKDSCENAGENWTGSYCCSEKQDRKYPREFYNDYKAKRDKDNRKQLFVWRINLTSEGNSKYSVESLNDYFARKVSEGKISQSNWNQVKQITGVSFMKWGNIYEWGFYSYYNGVFNSLSESKSPRFSYVFDYRISDSIEFSGGFSNTFQYMKDFLKCDIENENHACNYISKNMKRLMKGGTISGESLQLIGVGKVNVSGIPVGYFAINQEYFYRIGDNGKWQGPFEINNLVKFKNDEVNKNIIGQITNFNAYYSIPNSSYEFYITTTSNIYYSTDNGTTWQAKSHADFIQNYLKIPSSYGKIVSVSKMDENQFYVVTESNQSIETGSKDGACYNSTFVQDGNTTLIADKKLLVADRRFFGCDAQRIHWFYSPQVYKYQLNLTDKINLTVPMFNSSLPIAGLLDYPDNYENKPKNAGFLVNDVQYCSIVELTPKADNKPKYVCGWDEKWHPLDQQSNNAYSGSQLSFVRWNLSSEDVNKGQWSAGCCAIGNCWNGSSCINNMAYTNDKPVKTPIGELRCVHGEWVNQSLQYTWDRTQSGYCEKQSQCLVDPNQNQIFVGPPEMYYESDSAGMKCIENSTYIYDHYCDNGNWTTRTKLLAGYLLQIASSDYELYCDDQSLIAPYIDYDYYEDSDLQSFMDTFSTDLTSTTGQKASICLLKSGDKLIMGIVNNPKYPINQTTHEEESEAEVDGLLLALGQPNDACNSVLSQHKDEDKFFLCEGTQYLYYNPKLDLVIYSKSSISFPSSPSYLEKLTSVLISPFRQIVQFIIETFPGWIEGDINKNFDVIKYAQDFDQLMISSKGGKSIIAMQESLAEKPDDDVKDFIVVRYIGFPEHQDICGALNNEQAYSCYNTTDGKDYVARIQIPDTPESLFEKWKYISERTRIN